MAISRLNTLLNGSSDWYPSRSVMSANLCVESHLRDAEEKGYEVLVVNDATAAAGEDGYKAALTNYGFIAHESISTDQALRCLGEARR